MGNIIGALISSFAKVVGDLLGAPLDFLSGKSCSSVCGSTWDLICYIENFCVANLLRLLAVLVLLYVVMLFFYLLYKIGICQCIGRSLCKMLWAFFISCSSICDQWFMFIWYKLRNAKKAREEERLRRFEDYVSSSTDGDGYDIIDMGGGGRRYNGNGSGMPRSVELRKMRRQRSRERRRMQLERSLGPRNHSSIRIGINNSSMYLNGKDPREHRHGSMHRNIIKVTHTSKFVKKSNVKQIPRRSW